MSPVHPMNGRDLVALGQKALQLLDERRLDEWEQTMAPDAIFIGPGMELHGRAQIRQFVNTYFDRLEMMAQLGLAGR